MLERFWPNCQDREWCWIPCLRLKCALAVNLAYLVDLCGVAEPEGQLICRPVISNLFSGTPKKDR
jgi:hypothetical protein